MLTLTFLVIFVGKALCKLLNDPNFRGVLKRIKVSDLHHLSHLIFLVDVIYSSQGSLMGLSTLKVLLDLYFKDT